MIKINNSKIKESFNKTNIVSGIIISMALGFTVGFFSPMDIYLGNQPEFRLEFKKVFIAMFLFSLVLSAAIAAVQAICLLINEKIFKIIKYLLFGTLCAMYFQMIFYNGRVGALTGDTEIYFQYSVYNIVNYMVFFTILITPVFLWCVKSIKPDNKIIKKIKGKIASYVSIILAAMQLAGTINLVFANGMTKEVNNNVGILSLDEAMKLSDDENIIVFLTDRLDSLWLDEIIEDYPEINDMLEGFTFYQDNVSCYTNTFPSVPVMLTGCDFHEESISEYLDKIWAEHNLMDELYENDFRLNILTDRTTTIDDLNKVKDIAATYKDIEVESSVNYIEYGGIVPTMVDFSFVKLSPYLLKGLFAQKHESSFANYFYKINYDYPERFPPDVGKESDFAFYNYLKSVGINTESDKKTFNFIHLDFAHSQTELISSLYSGYDSGTTPTYITNARGSFEIINEYFKQMKELGVYDKSTIILIADHGRPPLEIKKSGDRLEDVDVASLLIKPANAERAPLKFDSTSEMSNQFFPASILEYAGIDHSRYGVSYNDVLTQGLHTERLFNGYQWDSSKVTLICRYVINGNSRDFDNWIYY